MRITAGQHKGRQLAAPAGLVTRPTSGRAREALFNILRHWQPDVLAGQRVLDVFAGSGAFGLESLSRGAAAAVFVENHPKVLPVLQANIVMLKEEARCRLIRGDAARLPVADAPCRLVFLDPPYRQGLVEPCLNSVLSGGWLADEGLVVVETAADETFTPPMPLTFQDQRRYGAAMVWLLTV